MDLGLDLDQPVCCYEICKQLGIKVKFVNVSMEGFYQQGKPPRIYVSSQRPNMRRHFTCAHELGHHQFGHGSNLDELEEMASQAGKPPEERLADMFAGHLLMPALGLKKAFRLRGVSVETADAISVHAVAGEFGVSFDALLTQLAFGLRYISPQMRHDLREKQAALKQLVNRKQNNRGLLLLDKYAFRALPVLETGQLLIVPKSTKFSESKLRLVDEIPVGLILQATATGRTEINLPNAPMPTSLRIGAYRFFGLADYRFLEEVKDA